MEQKMSDYALANGLRYDDYIISRAGAVKFRTFTRSGKEKWFVVIGWRPFVVQPIPAK